MEIKFSEVCILNSLKKIICMILLAVLCVSLVACGGDGKEVASSGTPSSDESSYREPYDAGEEEVVAYVDTDGEFDYTEAAWEGPDGYVIVVPAGNTEAKKSAVTLQEYFARQKVTLRIVTDNTKETEKEILIGKTNRSDSNKDLKENQLEVSVKGKKLVFDGGHDVTVDSAVKKFTRLEYQKGKAYAFALDTDFSTTLSLSGMEDYKYVWGDEFEEAEYDDINWTKWGFTHSMTGTDEIQTSQDRICTDIGDGRLKLFAVNTYNIENPKVRYIVPWATSTRETMNFVYGYAEIRARVPFFKGAWPSYWGGSACTIRNGDGTRFDQFHTEIDVFEIFGSTNTVSPNLHKWYEKYDYAGTFGTTANHTQWEGSRGYYKFKNDQQPSYEYHTYGFEWTPTEMSMWVDGEKYNTFDISKSWDENPDMQGFHEPSYLMFNNHVFAEDSSFKPNTVTDNVDMLPAEYFIDWYRVYQKNDGKSKIYIDETPTRQDRPVLEDKSVRR